MAGNKLIQMLKYNWKFWIFVLGILSISCITLWTNNYSSIKLDNIANESIEYSKTIQEMIQNTQKELDLIQNVLNGLLENRKSVLGDEELLNITDIEINSTLKEFVENYKEVRSYFYHLNIAQNEEFTNYERKNVNEVLSRLEKEGGSYWEVKEEGQSSKKVVKMVYILSLLQNDEPIGFIGMEMDMEYIKEEMENILNDNNDHCILLVSGEGTILYHPDPSLILKETKMEEDDYHNVAKELLDVQGEGYRLSQKKKIRYIYSYNKFSTGQIYIAVQLISRKVNQSNALILILALIAISTVALTHNNYDTKRNQLDRITDRIMVRYLNNLNQQSIKGQRAVIVLHIGMAGAVLADAIYSIILGKELNVILEYFIFFSFILILMGIYTHSKRGLTNKTAYVVAFLGITFPIIEHLMAGGFESGRAGDGMLWLIVALFVGLFILGEEKSISIFNLFVVVLFIDLLFEIFLLKGVEYEKIFNFVTSFFFLGLACFVSMGIYVSSSQKDYEREEELIKQLEENQSLLVQKEKMETLGQLISGVAHDINTPIGAIKASIETMDVSYEKLLRLLMEAGQKWDESEYEYLEQFIVLSIYSKSQMKSTKEIREGKRVIQKYLEAEGVRNASEIAKLLAKLEIVEIVHVEPCLFLFQKDNICEILNDVTKMSSFLSGIPTTIYASERISSIVEALKSYVHSNVKGEEIEFDIIKSIENVLILYHSQLKASIEVETEFEDELPPVYGNPDEMSQVWTNLIQNAIYEMKERGGTLTIEARKINQGIEIIFSDTGNGIPENVIDKIFNPFFTTKEIGDGSGLGLNIVKKAVERYGGTINVKSKKGLGTKFYICLPIEKNLML